MNYMIEKFDKFIDRKNTNSIKWDGSKRVFGTDDLLPMWVADSDWKAPQVVIEAIKERIEHGVFGYTEPGGELNEVVVNWVKKRYNWDIEAGWLVYISGVVPAVNVALTTFTGLESSVILQPPVYYPFFAAVKKSGAKLIENQLIYKDNRYYIDFSDLEKHVNNLKNYDNEDSMGKKKRNILVLCSPHNPVGRVWREEELQRLVNFCLEHNILIVSDEIHADIIYSDYKHIPIASISENIARQTITMIAPSKTFNLAGLSTAVTIIPDSELRSSFIKTMKGLVTGGNIAGYTAMKAAYSKGEGWLRDQLVYLEKNRNYAVNYIDKYIPGIEAVKPEGTYLLWINCRGLGLTERELEKLMVEQAGVGLDFGIWFGNGGEGFMRLNMACPGSLLEDGLNRIRNAVKNCF